jgi:hypothetical protein
MKPTRRNETTEPHSSHRLGSGGIASLARLALLPPSARVTTVRSNRSYVARGCAATAVRVEAVRQLDLLCIVREEASERLAEGAAPLSRAVR